MNLRDEQFFWKALVACTLLIGLIMLFSSAFRSPAGSLNTQRNASQTRTALALTEQLLYGPFPTATGPTPTAAPTRRATITPTPTSSPTATATPFRFFIDTATPRTRQPNPASTLGSTATSAPIRVSTSTPIPATAVVIQPTNTSEPPLQPTDLPPTTAPIDPTPCLNPQGHPIPCRKN